MNAFPSELLYHHFACMIVTGLTPPSKPATPSSSSPSAPPSHLPPDGAPSDHPTTLFPDLTKSLHDILSSRARNTLWDPSRGRSAVFHTVFADHTHRLPPLKTKPSARHVAPSPTSAPSEASLSAFSALPPRSPLSPLHPNSPQFPDGLIAPVWVRKHRELVPSVFVSFYTLPTAASLQELKEKDEALIKLISDRRRGLAERGIKLTIVLLTQRQMLEDGQLEARLSFIRRNSGLDSKASLFVLTPVSKGELGEFVSSLHSALFESAADYYREHSRRVKRKRTRYPPPPSTLQPIATALSTLSPKPLALHDISWLSREGWILRSEYKLALFAELSGDLNEALLRYREAYDLLCNSPTCLLGSTLMLPPRTKRWAEAKVLADTLSVRICKLLLYNDDTQGAALAFRKHLARFTELSTGWGIGAMTFEYWSWLSKQYKLFAELVESATRSPANPLVLPEHAPPLPSKLLHPSSLPAYSDGRGGVNPPLGMLVPNQNAIAVSVTPYTTLQSAGAYYYLAALCTVERRSRFLRASSSGESEEGVLAHEKKVDYTASITETLTRSYDAFKRAGQHRGALMVAARIAGCYLDGGQAEMALKFLERILRSYKKEEVGEIRASLLGLAVQASVEAADRTAGVRLLMEVLDPNLPMEGEVRTKAVRALTTFLMQGGGGEGEEGVLGVTAAFIEAETVMPAAEVESNASVPFQLTLRNSSFFDLGEILSVESLTVHIESGEAAETIVEIAANSSSTTPIVDLGSISTTTSAHTTSADLGTLLRTGGLVALQGSLQPSASGPVRISSAALHAKIAGLRVVLDLLLPSSSPENPPQPHPGQWVLPSGRTITLSSSGSTLVKSKTFSVTLDLSTSLPTNEPGYLDEHIPITISFTNHESEPLQAWIDATLLPSYDGAKDVLSSEREGGEGQSVKHVSLGTVELGEKGEVVVWLLPVGKAGIRNVDVTLRVAPEGEGVEVEQVAVAKMASLQIEVGGLFDAKPTQVLSESRNKEKALMDFTDDSEEEGESLFGLDVEMLGTQITVTSIDLVHGDTTLPCTVEEQPALGDWLKNDSFSFSRTLPSPFSQAFWRITWHRPSSPSLLNTTTIPHPPPSPVGTSTTGLTLNLTYSTSQHIHSPFDLNLSITNHHATQSYSLILTLDSDERFTLAATRRLSLPYVLPGQRRELRGWARLVPQQVGRWSLPNVEVRVRDPGNEEGTLAVVSSNDRGKREGGEEGQGWRDVVRFDYEGERGGMGEEGLPEVTVRL